MGEIKQDKVEILLVDDRPDGLIALEAVLQDSRYDLVKAPSGRRALELIPNHDFAVIVLDVQMPIMDGFETARRIKEDVRFRELPIIFVTALNHDDRYVSRAYESGAVDYLFKPFDPQILRSKVAVFVEMYRKSQTIREQERLLRVREQQERIRERELQQLASLLRYRNLADAIPHIVWRFNADRTLEYFNRKWLDYSGMTLADSSGSGWQNAFHGDDLQVFLADWEKSFRDGTETECECRIRRHDGEFRWHRLRVIADSDVGMQISGWIMTATDFHESRLAVEEAQRLKMAAESANEAKTEFLANMSHEIRTPLSAILGFTELMQLEQKNEDERVRFIATIRRNGELLLKIIDEVLDLSKIEAGQIVVEKGDVDLRRLLIDIRSLTGLKASEKGLQLEFNIVGDLPRWIQSDATRVRQILLNIIGNAVKFTSRGSVKVTVCAANGRVRIAVDDSGVGIGSGDVGKLFQPFVQAESSTSRRFGGTGLGLALSRRLARALSGDVWLEKSTFGVGSTFVIELPVKSDTVVTTPASTFSMLDEAQEAPRAAETGALSLNGIDVLLIEDSVDNQHLISRYLHHAGAHVEVASNGLEGVAKALRYNYGLVLMDIQMPQLDGYQATMRLRQNGYDGPIIALTAHAFKEERERCLQAGCNDHLSKPVERSLLIEKVAGFTAAATH